MSTIRAWFETHPKLTKGAPPVIHSVKSRLKDASHLEEKINRKLGLPPVADPTAQQVFEGLTDLAGVRVLLLHQQQFENLHTEFQQKIQDDWFLVEPPKAYTWDPESADFFRRLKIETHIKESQYTSLHYVIRPKEGSSLVCEIQVRTLFEEIWGEVDHTLNYPAPTDNLACSEQLRVLAKVVGAGSRLVDSIFKSAQTSAPKVVDLNPEIQEGVIEHLAVNVPVASAPAVETPVTNPDENGPPVNPEVQ
ncbi:RelA/SpoT domain-containing protein [Pseudomonas sp. GT1P32]